jgi:hypothetical protein
MMEKMTNTQNERRKGRSSKNATPSQQETKARKWTFPEHKEGRLKVVVRDHEQWGLNGASSGGASGWFNKHGR